MTVESYKPFTGQSGAGGRPRSYVLSPDKAKIVDIAIRLGRPLLVEGEAGCGKTRLADAIADELGLGAPIVIPVRSTSRANDLFYRYDALRRLQESQIPELRDRSRWAHNYVELEPLGLAIQQGARGVILIDEIDKADVDLPNDLLHAVDRFEFTIDEIPEAQSDQSIHDGRVGHRVTGPPGQRPIVIFTSNRERPLPKPFLRRCLFVELTFPDDPAQLAEIVQINLVQRRNPSDAPPIRPEDVSQSLVQQAVSAFLAIRQEAETNNAYKKPATAELIDWIHALHWEPPSIIERVQGLTPPYWEMLFSATHDLKAHRQSTQQAADH